MSRTKLDFQLIEDQKGLQQFRHENEDISWLSFDTEFVGEKRFVTSLCLVQVKTEHGLYLIDPFKVNDLIPLLELIENESVVKITHAGDNDYRLLNSLFDTVPKNVFDTQIAAGFVGYKYPISFRKLVESELQVNLDKGYAVTDWEARPFSAKQLDYALEDVMPLYDLWTTLSEKLEEQGRMNWAKEEFAQLESPDFYFKDPNHEALNSELMKSLNKREKVFLMRLLDWRRRTAEEKNYSKEMVLSGKLLGQLVRGIASGREALFRNRRLPDKLISQYGQLFEEMFHQPPSEAEKYLIKQIPTEEEEDPREDLLQEMLYLLVKYRCIESGLTPAFVLPRNAIRKLKNGHDGLTASLEHGWRRELLGDALVEWLLNVEHLDLKVAENRIELLLKK
ncbi:MAG: ribonuclease D [Saprospiraceae bacterium]|nr:ribonuclease D [Saprospiraceae bacterium]